MAVHTSLGDGSHQPLPWSGPDCSLVPGVHPGRKPAHCLVLLMLHLLRSSFHTEPCSTSPGGVTPTLFWELEEVAVASAPPRDSLKAFTL